MSERSKILNVRMHVDELDMLKAVAAREGISASDWIRQRVRLAYLDAFGAKQPKLTKKTKR